MRLSKVTHLDLTHSVISPIISRFDNWKLYNLSFLRQIVPSTLDLVGTTRSESLSFDIHLSPEFRAPVRGTLPKYYTEVAFALKSEYEAIETDELRATWLSNKIAAYTAIKDVNLFYLNELASC